jgi:hypothetical protein
MPSPKQKAVVFAGPSTSTGRLLLLKKMALSIMDEKEQRQEYNY